MGTVAILGHLAVVAGGAPAYTWLAYRFHARKRPHAARTAADVRRRVLKASAQIELFLVYSFLLLADKYPVFRETREALGVAATAVVFSLPVLLAYLLGAWSRAAVDVRVRRFGGRLRSVARFHLLLLFLRMGAFVLVTPVFFVRIYDLDLPAWHVRNLLGAASASLFFFLYVLRGPNVILGALGVLGRFPDRELEDEIRAEAKKRRIAVRGIRVLRTWESRFAGAFAHFGSSHIFVTDHLPEVVDRDELKAVLYHEVAHLGQLASGLIRILGSYSVFLVFVYVKYVIDATAERRIGFETLVPGFVVFGILVVIIRWVFERIIREGEARADLFSAELVGGRRPYQQAIAKVLLANGLSMQFTPSAAEVAPSAAPIEEEMW